MVLNNQTSKFQPNATSLPSQVGRNEAYMNDALASRLATLQKSAKLKQDTRHVGGIWDHNAMDTSEFNGRETPLALYRNETIVVPGKQVSKGIGPNGGKLGDNFAIDSVTMSPGVTFVSDEMDTSDSNGRNTDGWSSWEVHKQKPSGPTKVAIEGTMDISTKENQLFPPQTKKKNSDDERYVEKSKKCKTTNEYQRNVNKAPLAVVPPIKNEVAKNATVQSEKKNASAIAEDKLYLSILEGSPLNSSTNIKDERVVSGTKKIGRGKFYQEEIKILKRVSSILESYAIDPTKLLGSGVSFSKEIECLQRVCGILKGLEAFSHIDSAIVRGNRKKDPCADTKAGSGEAVDFLMKKEIQCSESKSIETSLEKQSNVPKNVAKSCGGLKIGEQNAAARKGPSSLPDCVDAKSVKQAEGSLKNNHVEKQESTLVVSESTHGGTISSEVVSPALQKETTIINKIMNGILSWTVGGSSSPATPIGATVQEDKSTATTSMAMDTAIQFQTTEAMDIACQPDAMTTQPLTTLKSSKAKGAPTLPKAKVETLPSDASATFKPAMPPTAKVLGETSQSKVTDVTSLAKAVVELHPSGAEGSTSVSKSNEVQVTEATQNMSARQNRSYEVAPRFARLMQRSKATEYASPKNLNPPLSHYSPRGADGVRKSDTTNQNPPLRGTEVAQSWRGERPAPYATTSQRRNYSEPKNDPKVEPQTLYSWRATEQNGNMGKQVERVNGDVSGRSEKVLPWRVKDEASIAAVRERSSYDIRQRQTAKARSPPLRSESASKMANSAGRSSVGNWRDNTEKKSQNVNAIEKNDLNMKHEEKAALIGTPRKSTSDSSLVLDSVCQVVVLKVFDEKEDLVDEMMVPNNELMQVQRKYPGMVPFVNAQRLDLEYTADAMVVFLRCICSMKYTLPSWEIALEAFALAKRYEVEILQNKCKDFFDNKSITQKQVQYIMYLARKFQIMQVLKTSLMFAEVQATCITDSGIPPPYKKVFCSVSCTPSVEPSEFDIPLQYVEDKSLGGTKQLDIQNEIVFAGSSRTFCITGFQIKVESGRVDLKQTLSVYFEAFKGNNKVFGEDRQKSLIEDMMIINFKKKLFVKPKENVRISVLIEDLYIRQCYCLKKESVQEICTMGSFNATFSSDKKNDRKKLLFFIEKVFYTFEV